MGGGIDGPCGRPAHPQGPHGAQATFYAGNWVRCMPLAILMDHKPKLLHLVRNTIRLKHYSIRTERAYVDWIKRFIVFHHQRHSTPMSAPEIHQIVVRDGKGQKGRVTMLPQALVERLKRQLETTKVLHEQDLAEGIGRVYLPFALDRQYPLATASPRIYSRPVMTFAQGKNCWVTRTCATL